ncbi:MAG: hypothetical protein FWD53_12185 [Phycisphaerales bacterium]|nr:hypothetical protein [Phycisphaerales bacterium]
MSPTNEQPRELTRDDLPDSILPFKSRPIGWIELVTLSKQPQRLVKLPRRKSPESLKPLMRLAQYKGRSPEGNLRSLANLRRPMEPINLIPVTIPPELPQPKIPISLPPPDIRSIKKRSLKAVLTKEEYDLYADTWKQWMERHAAEYQQIEDEEDVHTICMETVLQFRINLYRLAKPTADCGTEYNQSFRRMQQARENLAARRVDREGLGGLGGKGKGKNITNNTLNIAVMAGQADEKAIMELQRSARKQLDADAATLDGMKDTAGLIAELDAAPIEVKAVEVEPVEGDTI